MTRIPASRTSVPPLPPWFTPRPAVWCRVARAGDAQLVAVIAPAGSGKTVLLAEWAHHDRTSPTAWASLEPGDADPLRLWSTVLAAVVASGAVPADSSLARLHRRTLGAASVQDGGDFVDELLDGLDALRPRVRLVLDDVHVLSGHRPAVAALTRLVRRHPAGVRLVLAARSDPPVGLARLRLEGALCELRAEQLRFDLGDAAALVASCGVDLSPRDLRTLHRRTEGWAAGLRLAALALRTADEAPAEFLARFSGDERSVADYLGDELLAGLSADTRGLLADLSVCARLPAGLAVALTGRADAVGRLDEVGRSTGMVEHVAPGEHRMHPLLRSHLAGDLVRHRPARHRSLHADAARWWAAHGEASHALRHAERARGPELTAELLPRLALRLLLEGDHDSLWRALETAGRAAEDPDLAPTVALAHLAAGQPTLAAARLRCDHAPHDRTPRDGRPHDTDLVLAATEWLVASITGASITGQAPVTPPASVAGPELGDDAELRASAPEIAALVHLARAAARQSASAAHAAGESMADLDAALSLARDHGLAWLEVTVLSWLAAAAALDDDPRAALERADAAIAAARHRGRHPSGWTAVAVAVRAAADLARGHHDRARGRCAVVLDGGDALPPQVAYALHAIHGAAVSDRDGSATGIAEARTAREALGDAPLPVAAASVLGSLEHRAALALGNLRAADDVVAWLVARTGETDAVVLARAWADAAAGRYDAARAAVAPLSRSARSGPLLVEVRLLEAEAALQAGDPDRGDAALDAAVAAGRALDLVLPFALAGPRTRARVLERHGGARHDDPPGWSERVTAACASARPATPLSERELVVLALLPSLLNAPDMAEELVVSVNTVKTQIRSIYAKLGVSTRRDAVARARDRGLLA